MTSLEQKLLRAICRHYPVPYNSAGQRETEERNRSAVHHVIADTANNVRKPIGTEVLSILWERWQCRRRLVRPWLWFSAKEDFAAALENLFQYRYQIFIIRPNHPQRQYYHWATQQGIDHLARLDACRLWNRVVSWGAWILRHVFLVLILSVISSVIGGLIVYAYRDPAKPIFPEINFGNKP